MTPLVKKVYLQLGIPDAEVPLADRERILARLAPDTVRMGVGVLRKLAPLCAHAEYNITLTLAKCKDGWEAVNIEAGDTTARLYGLALDIGSTTLQMQLIDLNSAEILAESACTNSQTRIAEDILGRITYAKDVPEHLWELHEMVASDINALIEKACRKASVRTEEIGMLVVAGNTTMQHLLFACDPWGVFSTPYSPAFLATGFHRAADLDIHIAGNLYCIPSIANYLGGDIIAGLLATDMDRREDLAVFLDIGTNGELVVGSKAYLIAGAGAAGPALEGGISQSGMRAERGAVCSVHIDRENRLHCVTIDDAPPRGICGSGIVDLLAEMYLCGWMNGNGTLNPERSQRICTIADSLSGKEISAIAYAQNDSKKLFFTQADIQEFIRTKAAAHTMVATVFENCGYAPEDIGTFYLSGGFGTHLNLRSAITIGMYPDLPEEKFSILGNSALTGARMLLLDDNELMRIAKFQKKINYVQFGEMDRFLENMVAAQFVPHTDAHLYPSVQRRV